MITLNDIRNAFLCLQAFGIVDCASAPVPVDKLAVAKDHRHRGIARALLQTAFVRSSDRGYTWTSLSTDSRTDALSLYRRVGMTIHRSYTSYALDL